MDGEPSRPQRRDIALVSWPLTDESTAHQQAVRVTVRPAVVVGCDGDDVVVAFISSGNAGVHSDWVVDLDPGEPGFAETGLRAASRVLVSSLVTLHRSNLQRRLGQMPDPLYQRVCDALRQFFQY